MNSIQIKRKRLRQKNALNRLRNTAIDAAQSVEKK